MNRRSKNLALAGSLAAAVAALAVSAQAAGMDTGMQSGMKPTASQCDGMKDCKDGMMKNDCSGSSMGHGSDDKMGMDKMDGSASMHTDCSAAVMKHDTDSSMPMKHPN